MSLSPIDYVTQIADDAYPAVDVSLVRPSVTDVTLLLQTRAITAGGNPVDTFNDQTRPNGTQAAAMIEQAIVLVLSEIKADIPTYLYPRVKQAVILQAAVLIENSFYQEQVLSGQSLAATYAASLTALMGSIEGSAGNAAGASKRVGSVIQRSTMTDYDEIYPLPPPRQIIEYVKAAAQSDSPTN